MFLEVTGNKYNYGRCQKSVLTRISTKMDVDIPVYRDVSRLFNFMYYTGVSIYFPYSADEGDSVLSRLLRILKCAVCFSIFLLLVSMTAFEIYQFTLLIWAMKNIGEIIPNIIWLTSFPLAVMAQVFYTVTILSTISNICIRESSASCKSSWELTYKSHLII